MKKKPLLKLIGVLNELDTRACCEIPGYIVDGIVDYLGECKCCAFCKNYGSHDNCPESHENDFDTFEHCDYFMDKRNDDKYRLPKGTVCKFYKDILSEADNQTMVEKNEETLKRLGFHKDIEYKTPRSYVKEIPVFNGLSIRIAILLNCYTCFNSVGENSADIWLGREYIGQEGGASLTTKADEPIENLLKIVNDVVTKNLHKLQSEFNRGLEFKVEDAK